MALRNREVYLAQLAEQAEQYEVMVSHMVAAVNLSSELSAEERNLLSVAFKNAVGSRRAAWRLAVASERREAAHGSRCKAYCATEYRVKIETELRELCRSIIELLDRELLPKATTTDQVFYMKMKADYHRYVAEVNPDDAECKAVGEAQQSYEAAEGIARTELPATHPFRLAVALNYSVFLYQLCAKTSEACSLARLAFETAIKELCDVPDDMYKDTTLILQLLRDNLILWSADYAQQQAEENATP